MNTKKTFREILRFFSPRWFIAIMGTGALANILQTLSGQNHGILHHAAVVLMVMATSAFPIALALILTRLFIDRSMLVKELRHSSLVQFYSAIFISAAICTTALLKIPVNAPANSILLLAKTYWTIALLFGISLIVFTPWRIITLNHGEPKRILGFWFLPPVGLFVLVFAGNFLALSTGSPNWINPMAILNALLMGVAIPLAIMIFTMFLFRALTYPFPQADVIPSFAIGLAPIGVSIIALLSYLPLLKEATLGSFVSLAAIAPIIKFASVLLWGFGLWWLCVALFTVTTAVRRNPIPVTLGYWAFIFPPAAYTIATLILGQASQIAFIEATGVALAYILVVAWTITVYLTIRGIFNQSIFNLPPSFAEIINDRPATPEKNSLLSKSHFQEKFPVFSQQVPKNAQLPSFELLINQLKEKIHGHPIAKHIADFDHHTHTRQLEGDMPDGILNAANLIFCFGPKIEETRMLAVRPRSFGIAEFSDHFVISFIEAPSPQATNTMKEWIHDLTKS